MTLKPNARIVGAELGRSYGFVQRLLLESSATMRARGRRVAAKSE